MIFQKTEKGLNAGDYTTCSWVQSLRLSKTKNFSGALKTAKSQTESLFL